MKMILQLQKHDCLVSAFAMVLTAVLEEEKDYRKELIKHIGHDGSELINDNIYRGHHILEIIDVLVRHYGLYPVVLEKQIHQFYDEDNYIAFPNKRFRWYLHNYYGVIMTHDNHALAWHPEEFIGYNPVGYKESIDDVDAMSFCIINR